MSSFFVLPSSSDCNPTITVPAVWLNSVYVVSTSLLGTYSSAQPSVFFYQLRVSALTISILFNMAQSGLAFANSAYMIGALLFVRIFFLLLTLLVRFWFVRHWQRLWFGALSMLVFRFAALSLVAMYLTAFLDTTPALLMGTFSLSNIGYVVNALACCTALRCRSSDDRAKHARTAVLLVALSDSVQAAILALQGDMADALSAVVSVIVSLLVALSMHVYIKRAENRSATVTPLPLSPAMLSSSLSSPSFLAVPSSIAIEVAPNASPSSRYVTEPVAIDTITTTDAHFIENRVKFDKLCVAFIETFMVFILTGVLQAVIGFVWPQTQEQWCSFIDLRTYLDVLQLLTTILH